MTLERGVRPTRGNNKAIAEWPTLFDGEAGRADYVLFAGLVVVGSAGCPAAGGEVRRERRRVSRGTPRTRAA